MFIKKKKNKNKKKHARVYKSRSYENEALPTSTIQSRVSDKINQKKSSIRTANHVTPRNESSSD